MIYLFGKNQLRGKASYIACMSRDSQTAGSCRWSGRSPELYLPVQRPRGALSCASSPGSVSGRLPSEVAGQPSAWSLEASRCPRAALPCTAREMPVTPPASPPPSPAPAWFGFLRLAFSAVHALQLTTSCSLFLAPSAALTPGLLHLSVLTQREGVASLRKPCALGVKEPSFLAEYHFIRGPHPPGRSSICVCSDTTSTPPQIARHRVRIGAPGPGAGKVGGRCPDAHPSGDRAAHPSATAPASPFHTLLLCTLLAPGRVITRSV